MSKLVDEPMTIDCIFISSWINSCFKTNKQMNHPLNLNLPFTFLCNWTTTLKSLNEVPGGGGGGGGGGEWGTIPNNTLSPPEWFHLNHLSLIFSVLLKEQFQCYYYFTI